MPHQRGDIMATINIEYLKEVEEKLFNIVEHLDQTDELCEAWHIVYKRLKKERLNEN